MCIFPAFVWCLSDYISAFEHATCRCWNWPYRKMTLLLLLLLLLLSLLLLLLSLYYYYYYHYYFYYYCYYVILIPISVSFSVTIYIIIYQLGSIYSSFFPLCYSLYIYVYIYTYIYIEKDNTLPLSIVLYESDTQRVQHIALVMIILVHIDIWMVWKKSNTRPYIFEMGGWVVVVVMVVVVVVVVCVCVCGGGGGGGGGDQHPYSSSCTSFTKPAQHFRAVLMYNNAMWWYIKEQNRPPDLNVFCLWQTNQKEPDM